MIPYDSTSGTGSWDDRNRRQNSHWTYYISSTDSGTTVTCTSYDEYKNDTSLGYYDCDVLIVEDTSRDKLRDEQEEELKKLKRLFSSSAYPIIKEIIPKKTIQHKFFLKSKSKWQLKSVKVKQRTVKLIKKKQMRKRFMQKRIL